MRVRRFCWLLLPFTVLWLDWVSKLWILRHILPGGSRPIIPGFFNLTLGFNPGFIFGTAGGASPLFKTILFVVAGAGALGFFGWEFVKDGTPRVQRVALGLILGGALGNGLDRFRHGAVVDFLDFVFWGWHYWTFNVADSFILCGAVILGITLLRDQLRATQAT